MNVRELILELSNLDPNMEIVIPGAPYDQPNILDRVGVVILDEPDPDTGLPAGEYIGLGIGLDMDNDSLYDENESPVVEIQQEIEVQSNYQPDYELIEAKNFEDFQSKLFEQILKDERTTKNLSGNH